MPKTKGQGLVFGILMSVTMAYGMEVYNVALKSGVLQHVGGFSDMRNAVFLGALKEASFMWLFVFLFSNLWGNRLGAKLADKLVSEQDSPFLQMLARSCCTVLVMCPTMSLVSASAGEHISPTTLPSDEHIFSVTFSFNRSALFCSIYDTFFPF